MALMDVVRRDWAAVDITALSVILLNLSSSIGIVFLNKWVFRYEHFTFSTVVTCLHFATTAFGLQVCAWLNVFQPKKIPLLSVLPLSLSFCGFVVSANLSLKLNSIAFYQICKTLTTPTIILVQTFYYDMRFSSRVKVSLGFVCIGVMIASYSDVELNLLGTIVALSSVVITSFYQIWVGTYQRSLEVNSMQLLYYQAPLSTLFLIPAIPFLDDMEALRSYEMTTEAACVIGLSCCAAFFVNLSIFLLIGKTSPITYNAVGHAKLTIIVFGGIVLFGYPIVPLNLFGLAICFGGLVWYTHIKLSTTAVAPPTPPVTTTVDEEHSKEIDVELQERRSE